MVALIPLPAKGAPAGTARMWINPEHITTMTARIERTWSDGVELWALSVDLKLQGVPSLRAWLDNCTSAEAADVSWQRFLAAVRGEPALLPATES
jgi:hypothetical protein